MNQRTPVGLTKTQGWEIGVRRTFPVSVEKAWRALMTQPGLGYWLGHGVGPSFKPGDAYRTQEGTTGFIRSYAEGSLIRLRWQPPEWDFASTLQIRVAPARTGATISIHHEKLQSAEQREAMRQHWRDVLAKLGQLIEGA
ncbi:MAG: SRPBCC domain-containing protein [Anaerolineae bacterium]|nr:SRPBCC domain-containing protein [Anaerolineae bacterium]